MYSIALSVAACLRAGTQVNVAWVVDALGFGALDRSDALAITPGGGRIGAMLSGAIDGQLSDLAGRKYAAGLLVEIDVSAIEATLAGLPNGGRVRCVLTPASELPLALWPAMMTRQPVCLVSTLAGDAIAATTLFTSDNINDAGAETAALFGDGVSASTRIGDSLVTVLWPTTRLVIVGAGPIAAALQSAAALLGWKTQAATDASTATGLIAGLSPMDNLVVMSHELELAGAALAAALSSDVGYIGALGSHKMQETRAEWLAYRGITQLDRINGPAGLDIGAKAPAEVAIAILAEALATRAR